MNSRINSPLPAAYLCRLRFGITSGRALLSLSRAQRRSLLIKWDSGRRSSGSGSEAGSGPTRLQPRLVVCPALFAELGTQADSVGSTTGDSPRAGSHSGPLGDLSPPDTSLIASFEQVRQTRLCCC
jgi:hypothetical protein